MLALYGRASSSSSKDRARAKVSYLGLDIRKRRSTPPYSSSLFRRQNYGELLKLQIQFPASVSQHHSYVKVHHLTTGTCSMLTLPKTPNGQCFDW